MSWSQARGYSRRPRVVSIVSSEVYLYYPGTNDLSGFRGRRPRGREADAEKSLDGGSVAATALLAAACTTPGSDRTEVDTSKPVETDISGLPGHRR